jgi:hypothetical protein
MIGYINTYRLLFMLVALVAGNFAFGQDLFFNQGAYLHLGSNAFIKVDGNARFAADSSVHMDGEIKLSGNLYYGDFTPFVNGANVVFIDSNLQVIDGDASMKFQNLTLEKTGGNLQLQTDIEIINQLILSTGLLDIENHDIHLDSTGTILNESDSNYIYGDAGKIISYKILNNPLNENIGNIGVEITSTENLGLTTITRSHASTSLGGNPSIFRSYEITSDSTFTDVDLNFHFVNNEDQLNSLSPTSLKIFFWDTVWTEMTATLSPSNNSLQVADRNKFGFFTFGAGGLLPVEFLSFEAYLNENNQVDLIWTTATEINNDYFTIQRSENGFEFEDLGILKGAGNSTAILNYTFEDVKPMQGVNYYRIMQTDYDGNFDYSAIRSVAFFEKAEIVVFPNPIQDNNICVMGLRENAKMIIYDVQGGIKFMQEIASTDVYQKNYVNIQNLQPGMYYYNLSNSLGSIKKGNLVKL